MKARPQQDMDEVRAMASDDSGLLFEMKKAGQDQEYKQLIVAIASVLNKEVGAECLLCFQKINENDVRKIKENQFKHAGRISLKCWRRIKSKTYRECIFNKPLLWFDGVLYFHKLGVENTCLEQNRYIDEKPNLKWKYVLSYIMCCFGVITCPSNSPLSWKRTLLVICYFCYRMGKTLRLQVLLPHTFHWNKQH